MSVVIRPTRASDSPALYESWQTMRTHNAGVDPRIVLATVSEQDFADATAAILERDESASFVAEEEGRLVGFITGGVEANQPDRLPERHVTVGYLYIDPSARRQGVAKRLVGSFAEWAKTQDGVSHLEMTVLAADTEAAAFWREAGFTPFIQRLWMPLDGGRQS